MRRPLRTYCTGCGTVLGDVNDVTHPTCDSCRAEQDREDLAAILVHAAIAAARRAMVDPWGPAPWDGWSQ